MSGSNTDYIPASETYGGARPSTGPEAGAGESNLLERSRDAGFFRTRFGLPLQ
jgi:hypothetical protein